MDDVDEELLAAVNDEYTQDILSKIARKPLSAPEIVEIIDASKPTVYRRLSTLEDLDFVATRIDPDTEGHHRKIYVLAIDTMHVHFDTEGLNVEVERAAEDAVDRFTKLVGDLS